MLSNKSNDKNEIADLDSIINLGKYDKLRNTFFINKNTLLYTLSNKDIDYFVSENNREIMYEILNNYGFEIDSSIKIRKNYIKFLKRISLNDSDYDYSKFISPIYNAKYILVNWKKVFEDDNEELSLSKLNTLFNNLNRVYSYEVSNDEKTLIPLAFLINNFKNNKDDAKKYLLMSCKDNKKENSNFKFFLLATSLYFGTNYSFDEINKVIYSIDADEINYEQFINNKKSYKYIFSKIFNNALNLIANNYDSLLSNDNNEFIFYQLIKLCDCRKINNLIDLGDNSLKKLIALLLLNDDDYELNIINSYKKKFIKDKLPLIIKDEETLNRIFNELNSNQIKLFIADIKQIIN